MFGRDKHMHTLVWMQANFGAQTDDAQSDDGAFDASVKPKLDVGGCVAAPVSHL